MAIAVHERYRKLVLITRAINDRLAAIWMDAEASVVSEEEI